ncbi:MAG: cyclic nucleotide-binding domain-containing protein [Planctomycetota bacterium]|jgi:CRP-like cAMP-binding protein
MSHYAPLVHVEDVLPILSRIAIFGGLSETHLYEVFRRLEHTGLTAGEVVFRRGDHPSHIYVVLRGRVDLLISENGVTMQKARLEVGDCFGECALIAIRAHTATAVAIEASELLVLSQRALLLLQKEDLGLFALLMMNLARELARRLESTDEALVRYLSTDHG